MKLILRLPLVAGSAETAGATEECDGRKLYRYRLKVGDEWTIPLVVVEGKKPKRTVLLIADSGFASQAERIKKLTAEGTRVVAVDPVLIGQANPAGGLGKNAMLLSIVGERPLGVQTSQLLAAAKWSALSPLVSGLELQSVGPRSALIALSAAAIDGGETFSEVKTEGATKSLKTFLEPSASYDRTPEAYCFGLLEWFDISDLRMLARNK